MTPEHITARLNAVRAEKPLVHNVTNVVVTNFTANILLALGASPAMVHSTDEVEDFVALARALVVNIGTLDSAWVAGMRLAARRANDKGIPFVLDPVGAGATAYRTRHAVELMALGPTVIRGNASEILALAGASGHAPKGVDSTVGSEAALTTARELAAATKRVVAITGAVDYVVDTSRVAAISGGNAIMASVTGMGCAATAAIGALLAVECDPFLATVSALAAFKAAGTSAAVRAEGPGSFAVHFLDALAKLDRAAIDSGSQVEQRPL